MPSRHSFAGSCRNPWLAFTTSSRFPFRRQLFVSLLNVSLSFQLPNVVSATITGAPSDEFPTLASQCLCVLLDFGKDPGTVEHVFTPEVKAAAAAAERLTLQRIEEAKVDQPGGAAAAGVANVEVAAEEGDDDDGTIPGNTFRLIAREFTRDARDCVFVFEAIRRMLVGHVAQDSGMLRRPKLRFVQQILVLLWRLINDSKTFLAQMLKEPDVNDITSSLCYLLWYSRTDPRQTGIAHVCTFVLLLLSGERNFAIMLNRPLSEPMSLREGPRLNTNCTHADLLFVVIHKVLVSAHSPLRDLANCYLTIACNVSSLSKRLSMASSVRLVKLFDTFSTPRFLFANANNHTLLETVIEILNNLVQYQYDGNSQLIYALCLNSKVADRISTLELPKTDGKGSVIGGDGNGSINGSIGSTTPVQNEAGIPTPDDVNQTDAASEHSDDSDSLADSIIDKFVPTQEWFDTWWPKLQLGTLQRLLNCLKPQVEELCKSNLDDDGGDRVKSMQAVDVVSTSGGGGSRNVDENTILEFLRESTMVGLLPVPHPIIVRRYTPNEFTDLWFMTFLWGTIFLDSQNQPMPLWSGRYLRLFDVTGGS